MYKYFGLTDNPQPFQTFATPHLISLAVILGLILYIIIFQRKLRNKRINKRWRYIIGTILVIQQASFYLWHILNGTYSLANGIPLNICGASVFLSIFLLFTEKYSIYEVVYFWGLAGTFQALLTPDMQGYNYPHYRFFQFFIGHGLIVVSVLFMTIVNQYRPSLKSLFKTFLITNLFAGFVYIMNLLTGGNYMFLMGKPESASLLDFLGPWPWYILALDGLALVFFFIFYLPFLINDRMSNRYNRIKINIKGDKFYG